MTHIYQFAKEQSTQGRVILARDPKKVMPTKTIRPVDFDRRVMLENGKMWIDGEAVESWVICVRP